MRYCPKCGTPIEAVEAAFCPECGEPIRTAAPVAAPAAAAPSPVKPAAPSRFPVISLVLVISALVCILPHFVVSDYAGSAMFGVIKETLYIGALVLMLVGVIKRNLPVLSGIGAAILAFVSLINLFEPNNFMNIPKLACRGLPLPPGMLRILDLLTIAAFVLIALYDFLKGKGNTKILKLIGSILFLSCTVSWFFLSFSSLLSLMARNPLIHVFRAEMLTSVLWFLVNACLGVCILTYNVPSDHPSR